jgi:hypothetical protein
MNLADPMNILLGQIHAFVEDKNCGDGWDMPLSF